MPTYLLPCSERIDCPGTDSPLQNISAEKPDVPVYSYVAYAHVPMPLGNGWATFDSVAVGNSTITRDDAVTTGQGIADNNAQNPPDADPSIITPPPADPDNIPPIPDGHADPNDPVTNPAIPHKKHKPHPTPPVTPPAPNTPPFSNTHVLQRYPFFPSDAQICSVACPPNIATYTYHLPAGAVQSAVSKADANKNAAQYACYVAQQNKMCLGDLPLTVCCDQPATILVPVTGPAQAVSYGVLSGLLPAGLVIDANTGLITGTPTTFGTYIFKLAADDAKANRADRLYTMSTIKITNPPVLPPGQLTQPYGCFLNILGATPPGTWLLTNGSLPPGLSLDSFNSVIAGTPTDLGDYTFTLEFDDAAGHACHKDFLITIGPYIPPSTCGTPAYKIAGYGPGVAAAIAALMPNAAPSALPEWDGVLRLNGSYYLVPSGCYAIAGKAIEIIIATTAAHITTGLTCDGGPPGYACWNRISGQCCNRYSPGVQPSLPIDTFTMQIYDGVDFVGGRNNANTPLGTYSQYDFDYCGGPSAIIVQDAAGIICVTGTAQEIPIQTLLTVVSL